MTIPTCLNNAPGILAAELTIDGLALCCFNQTDAANKFWEVAYPRHRKHSLAVTIEQVGSGRPERHRVSENLEWFNIRLTTGTNDIYSPQNFPHGGCRTGGFNRNGTGNNPNDIRWMVDVTGTEPQHGRFVRLKSKGGGRVGVTLARLHHSLFFTERPSDHPVRFSPRCASDPEALGSFQLGPTNREMGALMKAPTAGQIVFEGINIESLSFDANTSYKIEIINEDIHSSEHFPNHVKGDFHHLYDIIEVDGEQKELWAVPDRDGKVAPDGDCNPNEFGGGTLEPLIS